MEGHDFLGGVRASCAGVVAGVPSSYGYVCVYSPASSKGVHTYIANQKRLRVRSSQSFIEVED